MHIYFINLTFFYVDVLKCVCVYSLFFTLFYKMHNQPNINEAFLFNPVEKYLQSLARNQPKITFQSGFKINENMFKKL